MVVGRFALVCMLALGPGSGCTFDELPAELGARDCDDGEDNDDDGLEDCRDPDCQLHETCLETYPLSGGDAAADAAPDAQAGGGPDDGDAGPAGDAASPAADAEAPPPAPPSDAAPAADAEPEPPVEPEPPACDGGAASCTPDGCAEGDCEPPPAARRYRITHIEVEVPKQTTYSLDHSDCLDSNLSCAVPVHLPPFVACGCSPDPWVAVRQGEVEHGRTSSAVSTTTAQWAVEIELALASGDTLRLEVADRDLTDDQPIFGCDITLDAALLSSGELRCEQSFQTDTGPRDYWIAATFEPVGG